jgi:glucose/arabinose dehydrogenase
MTLLAEPKFSRPTRTPSVSERFQVNRRIALVLLVILLATFCWWAKGRGYRHRIIQMIRPTKLAPAPIRITLCRPADGATAVPLDTSVSVEFSTPRGGIEPASATETAMLIRTADQTLVPATIELSSPRRLKLRPRSLLEPGTNYTFLVGEGLQDNAGTKVISYAISFTTAAPLDPIIRFEKVPMTVTSGVGFTALVLGPDHMLYGGSDDGRIFRFPIDADGILEKPTIIDSLQKSQGGPRLLTGICFDPASTAEAPILWVSHGYYGFEGAPDWSGKITRISGRNLEVARDVVINLPRSVRDHLTNQPSFGPDGALYFPQGSNTAFGGADAEWGNRPERLLSASILRLDVRRVTAGEPLDVRTPDGGGTYNPYLQGAPLTIYAAGVRLAYDLLWADDGHLYVPTNGSSAGGNTPESTPRGLRNLPISEDDWLFRITPGKYYGHPNPQQGHFILNGGNPTPAYDYAEIPQYPSGTLPDPDWVPAVFDFGKHVSADGIIQYKSTVFGGRLKRRLLVCRYNVPGDIAVLQLESATGAIKTYTPRIAGFSGLRNPLDLVEDAANGSIYVSEYGVREITLLRPVTNLGKAAE